MTASDLTMEKFLAESRAVFAGAPPAVSEVTVSPSVMSALEELVVPGETSLATICGELKIHVDARLPHGTWHPGRPRLGQAEVDAAEQIAAWLREIERLEAGE